MNKSTKYGQSEKSLGLSKDEIKRNSGKQLVEYIPVKDTPFTVARNGDEWYVLMGKYRLTREPHRTKAEALQNANKMTWQRIMEVIGCMIIDELESRDKKAQDANDQKQKDNGLHREHKIHQDEERTIN